MKVAVVDYGSGNLHSALKAFERAASENHITCDIELSSDPDVVSKADRIVLPGVGAFADCRRGLMAIPGMESCLVDTVLKKGRPFLGICVGMQLLASRGHEHGVSTGLDWVPGDVVEMTFEDPSLKVPHMGWNTLDIVRPHPLLDGLSLGNEGQHAYFVHSFKFAPQDRTSVLAETKYGQAFASILGRDNIVGTQFHPEKSQKLGLGLIANFLRWCP